MNVDKSMIDTALERQVQIGQEIFEFEAYEPVLAITMTPMVNSMLRSVINTRFITALTNGKSVNTIKKAQEAGQIVKEVGTLFIGGGNLTFCQYKDEFAHLIRVAKNVVWLQDDYDLRMPVLDGEGESVVPVALREVYNDRRGVHLWSTVPRNRRLFDFGAGHNPDANFSYVNWNALAWTGAPEQLPRLTTPGLFYYGACRKGRGEGFIKYLAGDKVKVFCVSKNDVEKFNELGVQKVDRTVVDLNNILNYGDLTIYLQDKFGDKHNCSPSARLYEYLSNGIPFMVARESLVTLGECGMDMGAWVIDSGDAFVAAQPRAAQVQAEQHAFVKQLDPRGALASQITAAFAKLNTFEAGVEKKDVKTSLFAW